MFPLRNHSDEMMDDSNFTSANISSVIVSMYRGRKQYTFLLEATALSFMLFMYNYIIKHYFVLYINYSLYNIKYGTHSHGYQMNFVISKLFLQCLQLGDI